MRAMASRFSMLGITLVSAWAGAANTSTISASFVPAKPIERTNPAYPADARAAAKEGWVVVSFCTDIAGKVVDPVVESSSPDGEFDQVALTAVRSWKYQPARSNDEPIQQCGWAVNLRFDLGTPQGAKPAFIASWKTIIALIDAGHLSEASSQIDAITPWNNYEYARLMLLQAYLARAQHDARAELRALTHAVDWSEKLEPELLTNSLRRSFILNLQLGQLAAAETYFKQLRDKYAQSWTEAERRAGEHLVELIDGGSTLATPGLISRRARRDNGAAQWSTRLLRPSFAIDAPGGGVKRIEVQCQNRWYAAEFSASQVWKIPASWGECSLIVFGDEGAALKLIEYAKD